MHAKKTVPKVKCHSFAKKMNSVCSNQTNWPTIMDWVRGRPLRSSENQELCSKPACAMGPRMVRWSQEFWPVASVFCSSAQMSQSNKASAREIGMSTCFCSAWSALRPWLHERCHPFLLGFLAVHTAITTQSVLNHRTPCQTSCYGISYPQWPVSSPSIRKVRFLGMSSGDIRLRSTSRTQILSLSLSNSVRLAPNMAYSFSKNPKLIPSQLRIGKKKRLHQLCSSQIVITLLSSFFATKNMFNVPSSRWCLAVSPTSPSRSSASCRVTRATGPPAAPGWRTDTRPPGGCGPRASGVVVLASAWLKLGKMRWR